jgi:KDO2-lipid IV(A) lauroyltransferase
MTPPCRQPDLPFSETLAAEPDGYRAGPFDLLKAGLHALLRRLPVGFAPAFGSAVAPLAQWLNRRRIFARRLAWNLACLHPQAPLSDAQALAGERLWWRGAGAMRAEYAVLERFRDAGRVTCEGPPPPSGQVIFVAVHLGPFELAFDMVLNGLGRSAVGTWQPEPSVLSNRIVSRLRWRYGLFAFPPGQRSARHLHRCVVGQGFDAILFVDEVRDRQVHLPAFGRPLPERGNAVLAVKLALRTGASIVPVHVLRQGGGRYRFVTGAPLSFDRSGGGGPALTAGVAAIDAAIEPLVRANLAQWYMLPELRLPGFAAFPGASAQ